LGTFFNQSPFAIAAYANGSTAINVAPKVVPWVGIRATVLRTVDLVMVVDNGYGSLFVGISCGPSDALIPAILLLRLAHVTKLIAVAVGSGLPQLESWWCYRDNERSKQQDNRGGKLAKGSHLAE
jgi:hypothetical protein